MNNDLLTRRVQQILPSKEGLDKILNERKIRLYMGFDPSRPNLHIGHLVGLLQLKAFQDAGHEVIFLIGDFTGMIGDPTDKSATRTKLTHEEVLKNAETYKTQAGKFLRFEGENAAKIMFNYDWHNKLNFPDVLELASNITVQQLIERDMFQTRLKERKPIYVHEFLYPLIQGYDSVAMDVDLEVGGNDQMFNLMIGRTLLKVLKNKEKYCLTTKLLVDTAGNKIGKTAGNAVDLFGKPEDLYGGIMSVPDDAIANMLICATEIPMKEVDQLLKQSESDPMSVKKRLSWEITKICHDEGVANDAQTHFENTVQNQQFSVSPIKVKTWSDARSSMATLSAIAPDLSNSDLKRLINQKGIVWNNKVIGDISQIPSIPQPGDKVKLGKRKFIEFEE